MAQSGGGILGLSSYTQAQSTKHSLQGETTSLSNNVLNAAS